MNGRGALMAVFTTFSTQRINLYPYAAMASSMLHVWQQTADPETGAGQTPFPPREGGGQWDT